MIGDIDMNVRSKKNKGVRLQNYVVKRLIEVFGFDELDVKPAVMGETGVDIHLSKQALQEFPFSIECKNQERWNIPQFFKQAVDNTIPDTYPLLVVKRNRHEPLAVLRFEDFLQVIKDVKKEVRTNRDGRGGKGGNKKQTRL